MSLLAVVAVAVACGTPAPTVKTGTGVTDKTIRLGVLSDLSGPFGPLGEAVVQGNQLYVDKLNAEGGICGRQIELDVQDTGFDTNKATQLYFKMEPDVLGLLQVVGSDITSRITPDMLQQQVMAAPTSWSSDLLGNPYMVVVGATYDLDVINSLDYLVNQGKLQKGDTIGHIYLNDPEYGGDALKGSQFVADKLGLVEVE
jgi:ABC-type branched-subunit amino acid transport system substrate-binding protein